MKNTRSEKDKQQPRRILKNANLGPSIEKKVCVWIRQEMKEGRRVSRKNITKQACMHAQQHGRLFHGSQGWFCRFLARHPEIKVLLDMQRAEFSFDDHREESSARWGNGSAESQAIRAGVLQ